MIIIFKSNLSYMSPQDQNPRPTPPQARTSPSRCALVIGAGSCKVAVNLYHFAKQFLLADALACCYRVARSPGMLHAQNNYRRCGNPRRKKAKTSARRKSGIFADTAFCSLCFQISERVRDFSCLQNVQAGLEQQVTIYFVGRGTFYFSGC